MNAALEQRRAIILVLDSVGIGGAADAALYDDAGADTLGHIAEACSIGVADKTGLRCGPLALPNLMQLGLGASYKLVSGRALPGSQEVDARHGLYGAAAEISKGKDTPSGHWEIAGVPVPFDWGYFPRTVPCFPNDMIEALCQGAELSGILGNCHASGTAIIAELGEEHIRTGKPICYTSADSVFQIAAHEDRFGLTRLYAICQIARELLDPLRIGRVIARPFVGSSAQDFKRTGNRRDYSVLPPAATILDTATADRRDVISIGKIADIFAHSGTGRSIKGNGNDELFERMLSALPTLSPGGLMFANFVDFDSEFGHRRDVAGYAAALERFDRQLPRLMGILKADDLLVITADHGCDPTWRGTDHTREQVPILAAGASLRPGSMGRRRTYADVGATVAHHLGLSQCGAGSSFL